MAQLILGQFRWLDCLADPHVLTATLLEILPAMPPEAQHDAVDFFPEIAPEEDYPAVLDALENLVAVDPEFLIPVLEATATFALTDDMQAKVTDLVASRVPSADVKDLPALVRHLLQSIGNSNCKGTSGDALNNLRQNLHFATISDPRLVVSDRKQKHRVPSMASEVPEAQVLAAMRQAVFFSRGVCDAVLRDLRGLTDPQQHRTFDFWILLALSSLGGDHRRSVVQLLRKKLGEGHVEKAWMLSAVRGHAAALSEHFFFSELVGIAQRLLADPQSLVVAAAGSDLYCVLFTEFTDSIYRQDLLLALHAHLGTAIPGEANTALGVLQRLAHDCTDDLLQFAAYLTNILDYMSEYSDGQLAAAFDVFAELVAGTCRSGTRGAAAQAYDDQPPSALTERGGSSSVGGQRSRMEDELFIFLRKQLSGAMPCHRRVGAVGTVAVVQKLCKELQEHCVDEHGETLLGK